MPLSKQQHQTADQISSSSGNSSRGQAVRGEDEHVDQPIAGSRTADDLLSIYRPATGATSGDFPLDLSVGYQVRTTHRTLQRYLQSKIEPHGVTLGMWYFLRVLWQQDGVTQSDLSRSI